jgi:hypothetical protein
MPANSDDINRIGEIASLVRRAIESCSASELPWRTFPKAACGDTSLVLGQFLHEAGFVDVEYICGDKYRADGKGDSHAWLRYEGLIVDITADQFPEVEEKVILTRSSEWHMGWEQDRPEPGALQSYGFKNVLPLWELFGLLKKKIALLENR